MPCIVVLLALMFPRVILVLMWLFSMILQRAYGGMVVPLLGFIFLPVTTIAYAYIAGNGLPMNGFNLFLIVVAVLIDVGSSGGGSRVYRRR